MATPVQSNHSGRGRKRRKIVLYVGHVTHTHTHVPAHSTHTYLFARCLLKMLSKWVISCQVGNSNGVNFPCRILHESESQETPGLDLERHSWQLLGRSRSISHGKTYTIRSRQSSLCGGHKSGEAGHSYRTLFIPLIRPLLPFSLPSLRPLKSPAHPRPSRGNKHSSLKINYCLRMQHSGKGPQK